MELGNFNRGSGQQAPPTPGYPQLKIDHGLGTFYISNDEQSLGREISMIGLGLMRSRTYWSEKNSFGNNAKPMCKSHDGVVGIPTPEIFPWHESEFASVDSNDRLPCASCNFKGFLSGEKGIRCAQTWTIPCLLPGVQTIGPDGAVIKDQIYMASFTASSIKNLTPYLKPLRDQGIPLYSRVTGVTLKKVSKGDRIWTEAEFANYYQTDERWWPKYSTLLREARDFMQPKNEGVGFTPLTLK